mmetsp:Transcript_2840/g.7963  ORF Transcript_2840/g.7963 Transcript_2840/m.7963 type:complete len:444 (-) Transcript_2840:876-2207(-)
MHAPRHIHGRGALPGREGSRRDGGALSLVRGGRSLAGLLVVGDEVVGDDLARAVRVEVAPHVVLLLLHVVAQLVKRLCRDHVARAVHLPRDRRVAGAHFVVARGAGGRAGVLRNVHPLVLPVHPRAVDEVLVLVLLLVRVYDCEDLALHADLLVRVERREDVDDALLAEDAVVEGRLVLPLGAAGARRRVRPVNLVRLANHHLDAVLPLVRIGGVGRRRLEHLVLVVVVVAAEAEPLLPPACGAEPAAVIRVAHVLLHLLVLLIAGVVLRVAVVVPVHAVRAVLVRRPRAVVVVLALREVLGAEVPVHVDSAQVGVVVVVEDGRAPVAGVEAADVAARDVGARLLEHLHEVVLHALDVVEVVVARRRVVRLLRFARVDGRVHLHLLEGVLRGGDADGDGGGDDEADGEAHHHLDETADRLLLVELLRALLERGEAKDDGKDEE